MDYSLLFLIIPAFYYLLSIILLCFPCRQKHRYRLHLLNQLADGQSLLCIGHRGGAFQGPQNTIQLFKDTQQVCHMYELDICQTKDNQLVVHHDTNLRRTTGYDKLISQTLFSEIPTLQSQIQSYGGGIVKTQKNKIPLLDSLFTQFPETLLNIELKTPTETAIKQFQRLVRKHNRYCNTVWGAFRQQPNEILRQLSPNVLTFYSGWQVFKIFLLCISGLLPFWSLREGILQIPLVTDSLSDAAYQMTKGCCGKFFICILVTLLKFFNLISRLFIPHLRKRGILTFYWIVNEEKDWERAISMGCRGIMTDEPTKLAAFLKQRGLYFQISMHSF